MKIQRAIYRKTGVPREVCGVEEADWGEPGSGELGVRMEYAPIHPADINQLEGRYGRSVELPAVPGGEGCGVVERLGAGVPPEWLGRRVILPGGVGTWSEWCVVRMEGVRPVDPGLDPKQAAMLRINPATAWLLLKTVCEVGPGDWVLQNAGNSAVGRAVAQLCGAWGIRVVSAVRRLDSVPVAEPGEVVVLDDEALPGRVAELAGSARLPLALNAVGGESALRLGRLLNEGGTVVTYGGMAKQPLRIPTGLLIFKDIRWRGFWLTRWWDAASEAAREEVLAGVERLALQGVLKSEVDSVFGLGELEAALERAQQGGRTGKVLLRLSRDCGGNLDA